MSLAPESKAEIEIVSVARDYSPTPGARSPKDGPFSGEVFLADVLQPAFERARSRGRKLLVDLDGTSGYATSFLEAAFGGLARAFGVEEVLRVVEVKSNDQPRLLGVVTQYIRDAND